MNQFFGFGFVDKTPGSRIPKAGEKLEAYDILSPLKERMGDRSGKMVVGLFHSLCFSCGSGEGLMCLEHLARIHPELDFVFLQLGGGSQAAANRYRQNYNLEVGILVGSENGNLVRNDKGGGGGDDPVVIW